MTKDQIKLLRYLSTKEQGDPCGVKGMFEGKTSSETCREICLIRSVCLSTGFAEWDKRMPEIKRLLQTIEIEATPGEY